MYKRKANKLSKFKKSDPSRLPPIRLFLWILQKPMIKEVEQHNPRKDSCRGSRDSICFHFENMSPLLTDFGLLYRSFQNYTKILEQKRNNGQNYL